MALARALNRAKVGFSAYMHRNPVFRVIVIRYPQIGGGIMSAFKAAGADYFAQTQIEGRFNKNNPNKKVDVNWTRNSLFAMLGFVHGGFINYFMHSMLNPFLFGTKKDLPTVVKSILFTQLVYTPVFAFPLFYAFRGWVYNNYSASEAKKSVQLYLGGNWKTDIPMAMKIWAPAHTITYTLIPLRYRIYWVNVVSFVWTTILSTSRGEIDKEDIDKLNKMSGNDDTSNANASIESGASAAAGASGAIREGITNGNGADRNGADRNEMIVRQKQIDGSDLEAGSIDANNNILDPGNRISPPISKNN